MVCVVPISLVQTQSSKPVHITSAYCLECEIIGPGLRLFTATTEGHYNHIYN